jgi:hypothetical protein
MANEIKLTVQLSASKDGATISQAIAKLLDLDGTEMYGAGQILSTTEAAIAIGGCDQLQVLVVMNRTKKPDGTDNTADVSVGLANPIVTAISVIPPGGCIVLMGCPTTLYAKASAGTPEIFVTAVED